MAEAAKSQDQVPDSSQDSVPYPFRTTTTQQPLVPNPSPDVPDQPVMVGGTNLTDLVQRQQGANLAFQRQAAAKQQQLDEQRRKVEQGSIEELEKDREEIKKAQEKTGIGPDDLKPWNADAEMQKYTTSPMEQFGSAGMMFAMLASAFTHQPMANALNAGASAMKAIQAGDQMQYQHAYEAWKANTDLALKRHQIEREKIQDAIELMSADATIGRAKLGAALSEYNNGWGQFLLENGHDDKLFEGFEAQNKAALNTMKAYIDIQDQKPKLDAMWNIKNATDDLEEARKTKDPNKIAEAEEKLSHAVQDARSITSPFSKSQAMSPGAQKAARIQQLMDEEHLTYEQAVRQVGEGSKPQAGMQLDEETATRMAEQYIAGDKQVAVGLGYGTVGAQNRLLFQKAVTRVAKEQGLSGEDIAKTIAEFHGLVAGETALGRRAANVEMAISEAQKMAPLALTASENVDRTRFPTLNEALLAYEQGAGDENVVRLGVATNSLINIYARAVNPNGVATVSDKDHARELLSAAWNKGQYAAGIDQLMQELSAARAAPKEVKQELRELGLGKLKKGEGTSLAPVKVKTPEEAAKLSPGTRYVTPDGQEYTR
jgi:hypothetical protein